MSHASRLPQTVTHSDVLFTIYDPASQPAKAGYRVQNHYASKLYKSTDCTM
uniref:Uncharacterized protein n=1 Tax=Anguilla anguilla TaxID=7936 RepID=A0A0E9R4V6_ANGAN